MKPIKLVFQCFGPYMARQCIDFEELERNGLFLICGETGAGKTTILDAICYALYGRSSGGLRGDMSVMRCKLAEKSDETLVEFIFDSNGKRYKFVRSLKYGRKNLNDAHNCLVLEGEEYVPIFENPKATYVNQKAQELIGLTYEQFRQVIILPQGQFEKLLVSDSAEKEKILVSLFHADRWQRIADELYSRVAQQDMELKQEKLQIAAKLREYGCTHLEALEEKTQVQRETLSALQAETAEAEKALLQLREQKEQAILEDRAFAELRQIRNLVQTMEREIPEREKEETLLRSADKAEQVRPQHTAVVESTNRKIRAQEQVAIAARTLETAQAELAEAEERQQKLEAKKEQQEAARQRLVLLENARELYRTLEEKKLVLLRCQKQLAAARTEQSRAENTYSLRDKGWLRAMEIQNRAMEDYRQTQESYLRGIGSTLARKLTAGEPCPVCGSREHPAPATCADGHVTDAQLEEKNKAMKAAGDAVSAAMQQRSLAEMAKNKAASACALAAQAEAVAKADYENALSGRIAGIEESAQLETVILTLGREVTAFNQALSQMQQRLETARAGEISARAKLELAREELAAAEVRCAAQQAVWEDALKTSGLGSEEAFLAANMPAERKQQRMAALIRFRSELQRARKELAERQAALEGRDAPDLTAIKAALDGAETAGKALSNRLALAKKALETMQSDGENLKERTERHDAKRKTVDADLDFANRLRGRSGVSLQRYVLGVMLTSITVEANRLLANVYGGRYRLYRTDEISGSGHKGGLELEVYDSQTNARRSVTTLSGGEKFLVALSLAIGLSTVVQAQGSGIRLEAMFIDEGFGSLDGDAVRDALEVLQGIQRSSGVVGIISHVESLAETIPTRLEITKGSNGSICRVCG